MLFFVIRLGSNRELTQWVQLNTERVLGSNLYKKRELKFFNFSSFRDPPGARTQDPNIKSVVLYQLS